MTLWRTEPADEALVGRLAAAHGLPRPLARVLAARGFDETTAPAFLNPKLADLGDPFELPGMAAAAERLDAAVAARAPIAVYGDYDVDGLTATALLVRVLRALGAPAEPFLPHRIEDGYGLHPETLDRCVETLRPSLVVTVDCGTNSVAAAARARELGIGLVVTDHHQPSGDPAPADALVNPRFGPPEAPWRDLAGVGVAFKLAHALLKLARKRGVPGADLDLKPYLALVALGTIADCVPLLGENRIFARHGLRELNRGHWIGLEALRAAAGATGEVDVYQTGFVLGPRLNASGRLGTAETSLRLLLADGPDEAQPLARTLNAANRERQDIERATFEEACAQLDGRFYDPDREYGVVAGSAGWHPGVIGIVASRLSSRYHRPAVVIAFDGAGGGRGSCRSIAGVNLLDCLNACAPVLRRHGGHAMAAGLELAEADVERFRAALHEAIAARVAPDDLQRRLRVDAWLEPAEADDGLADALAALRPCGQGNPEPVWGVRGVQPASPPRRMGEGGRHLRLDIAGGGSVREAVLFGAGDRPLPDGPLDLAFELRRNTWNGQTRLQWLLKDVRAAAAAPPLSYMRF